MLTFPFPFEPGGSLFGLKIRTSTHMTERVPFPRSPARAKRRAKLGHPQHMAERPLDTAYLLPNGGLVMPPAILRDLERAVKKTNKESTAPAADGMSDIESALASITKHLHR